MPKGTVDTWSKQCGDLLDKLLNGKQVSHYEFSKILGLSTAQVDVIRSTAKSAKKSKNNPQGGLHRLPQYENAKISDVDFGKIFPSSGVEDIFITLENSYNEIMRKWDELETSDEMSIQLAIDDMRSFWDAEIIPKITQQMNQANLGAETKKMVHSFLQNCKANTVKNISEHTSTNMKIWLRSSLGESMSIAFGVTFVIVGAVLMGTGAGIPPGLAFLLSGLYLFVDTINQKYNVSEKISSRVDKTSPRSETSTKDSARICIDALKVVETVIKQAPKINTTTPLKEQKQTSGLLGACLIYLRECMEDYAWYAEKHKKENAHIKERIATKASFEALFKDFTNAEARKKIVTFIRSKIAEGQDSETIMAEVFNKFKIFPINQGSLITSALAFYSMTDSKGDKVLPIFSDPKVDPVKFKEEVESLARGICFGMSTMFLFTSFISDMQKQKTAPNDEHDLNWFYRCLMLLRFPELCDDDMKKKEVAEFIGFVLHFQDTLTSTTPGKNNQNEHAKNVEFTGEHTIRVEREIYASPYGSLENMQPVFERPGPLYVEFNVVIRSAKPSFAHAISLHKDAEGKFTYYDPSLGVMSVTIENVEDLQSFISRAYISSMFKLSKMEPEYEEFRLLYKNVRELLGFKFEEAPRKYQSKLEKFIAGIYGMKKLSFREYSIGMRIGTPQPKIDLKP